VSGSQPTNSFTGFGSNAPLTVAVTAHSATLAPIAPARVTSVETHGRETETPAP
jgi:hypothetical protein